MFNKEMKMNICGFVLCLVIFICHCFLSDIILFVDFSNGFVSTNDLFL